MTAPVALYLRLATIATGRPPQYRAGLESRMRSLWKSMTDLERDLVRELY